jgi:hypothetical protein
MEYGSIPPLDTFQLKNERLTYFPYHFDVQHLRYLLSP